MSTIENLVAQSKRGEAAMSAAYELDDDGEQLPAFAVGQRYAAELAEAIRSGKAGRGVLTAAVVAIFSTKIRDVALLNGLMTGVEEELRRSEGGGAP